MDNEVDIESGTTTTTSSSEIRHINQQLGNIHDDGNHVAATRDDSETNDGATSAHQDGGSEMLSSLARWDMRAAQLQPTDEAESQFVDIELGNHE